VDLGKRFKVSPAPDHLLREFACRGVRIVGDVLAQNIQIMGPRDSLDSRKSFLCPVSTEYLRHLCALHVRSMAIAAIPQPDGLWGLCVFYHYTEPRHVTWDDRACVVRVAGLISQAAEHEKNTSVRKQQEQLASMLERLNTPLVVKRADEAGILHQLTCGHPDLCEMVGCSSFAFCCQDLWLRVGSCPSVIWLRTLAKWMADRDNEIEAKEDEEPRIHSLFMSTLAQSHQGGAELLNQLDSDTMAKIDAFLCCIISVQPLTGIFCFRHGFRDKHKDVAHPRHLYQPTATSSSSSAATEDVINNSPLVSASILSLLPIIPSHLIDRHNEWPVNAPHMLRGIMQNIRRCIKNNDGHAEFIENELRALALEMSAPQIQLSSLLLREYMDGILVVLRTDRSDTDKILCVNQGYVNVLGFPGETAGCGGDRGGIERTLLAAGVPLEGLINETHNTERRVQVWSKEQGLCTLQMYYRHVLNIHTDDAHIEILCLCFYDITKHERMRMSLQISQEQTAQLATAKQQLIGMVSHELRSPMNAVLGFTRLLQTDFPHQLTDRMQEYLNDIHSAGSHLLNLITDFARPHQGARVADASGGRERNSARGVLVGQRENASQGAVSGVAHAATPRAALVRQRQSNITQAHLCQPAGQRHQVFVGARTCHGVGQATGWPRGGMRGGRRHWYQGGRSAQDLQHFLSSNFFFLASPRANQKNFFFLARSRARKKSARRGFNL